MFTNESLQNHLETSSSLDVSSTVVAEWNLNIATNIAKIGNYRFRPTESGIFNRINNSYDPYDGGNDATAVRFYTGATDADVIVDGGVDNEDVPVAFSSAKQKLKMLYSLEDCFRRFRPRSGINKARFFDNKFTHFDNVDMTNRPRYYMPHRSDSFKYWSSYRTEDGVERGISKLVNGQNYITDTAPFVVYKDRVPANRIVVKMQTGIGDVNLGPFSSSYSSFADPFYGDSNKVAPQSWKIQYLDGNNWVDAVSFDRLSERADGSPIIGPDGYVEIAYGISVPEEYANVFKFAGEFSSANALPVTANTGDAFLVKESSTDAGTFFIWDGNGYQSFDPQYGWHVNDEEVTNKTNFVTQLVSPETFLDQTTGEERYREFQYISGVRVVVETMTKPDSIFDLIELSARLTVDISDKVTSLSVQKMASDLGISGMPVGQLLASTGSLDMFDYDDAFNDANEDSVMVNVSAQNIQIKIYENILGVEGRDFAVPIKVMYSDGFPEFDKESRAVSVRLRDLFLLFESMSAPQILVQDVSVSYAVSLILDNIGFTNYTFRRVEGEAEPIIPYFFVSPDKTVAEVLQDIAVSTQTAMFFDEYNNFVMMSKNYMMPTEEERSDDLTLIGSNDFVDEGILENSSSQSKLANIISLSSTNNKVYNDGTIRFTNRYIQRTYSSIKQANLIDRDKTWIYKPVLLWEVAGTEATKSKNDESITQAKYALSAIPLNSYLSSDVPTVSNGQIINNIIDFGDGVYWIARYNGYFYSNGEVIKYDAVEYNVAGVGNVWIQSAQEYKTYFSRVPFNGKLYPTGRVRIYAEPKYEDRSGITKLQDGEVAKHGRGQFGTQIVEHFAGLNPYWSDTNPDTAPVRGVDMESKYLFSGDTNFTVSGVYSEQSAKGDASLSDHKTLVDLSVESEVPILVTLANHGLSTGDVIQFSTDGVFPNTIDAESVYFVIKLTNDTFNIGSTPESSAMSAGAVGYGNYYITRLYLDATPSFSVNVGIPGEIVIASHGLTEGDRVVFDINGTPPGGLNAYSVYYVYSVIDENTFEVSAYQDGTAVDIDSVGSGVFTAYLVSTIGEISVYDDHRLVDGDPLYFVGGYLGTTYTEVQPLPLPLAVDTTYYANVNSTTSFTVSTTLNGEPVRFRQTHGLVPFIPFLDKTNDELLSIIVVPDASKMKPDFFVEFVSGTGRIGDGTQILSVDTVFNTITLNKPVQKELIKEYLDPATGLYVVNQIQIIDKVDTEVGAAGVNKALALKATRNGIMKNFLTMSNLTETDVNTFLSTQAGTIQSSALIFNGPTFTQSEKPLDFISYAYKELDDRYTSFGTRMRVIGQVNSTDNTQTPIGSTAYYTRTSTLSPDQDISISGGSGGLAMMVNPETNSGYYLEVITLSQNNLSQYSNNSEIHNFVFYKIEKNATDPNATPASKAIPVKLWGSTVPFVVDDGQFTGQYRMTAEQNPTVYDIGIEYVDSGNDRIFYIYLNDKIVATVTDTNPLPKYNNMALFVRGQARCMFENIFAITNNYAENTTADVDIVKSPIFGTENKVVSGSLRKYALSGMVQSRYLSGLSATDTSKSKIYFEEFGTIMREAAYMNIKYDKAYPALYSKISPTFNTLKGYTVAGYIGGSYGAEFLIFNNTDTVVNLDETTGNYLRIQGVTFTQQSQQDLKVDDYFSNISDFSNIELGDTSTISSITRVKQDFQELKSSRMSHGKREFFIDAPYIQDQDSANELMGWLVSKVMKPRMAVGLSVFGVPTLQLGDIVRIDYTSTDGHSQIASSDSRFVVYNIEYKRDANGPTSTVYVSEIL